MSELGDLYQELIVEHYNHPRNLRKVEGANRSVEGYNPFCGDRFMLYLRMDNGIITDIGFLGSGCAISKASTSLMTESVRGKSSEEAQSLFSAFHRMLTGQVLSDQERELLGDLEVLSGVVEFPIRVKCATLSWHTLRAALEGQKGTVATE
ncbi:MAG: SUF system NifU family Fe-S cluster assembly protein [Chloroflexi bacterium]|nr:SUF system NifU family Fe-S cluster assembly protein [Chloroflexota bacterium]